MYIGLLALLMLSLAVLVVKMRIRFKVGFGDDGHEPLLLAIRTTPMPSNMFLSPYYFLFVWKIPGN
jgi:uncharacterized membrane protein YecN with MAPEG domain